MRLGVWQVARLHQRRDLNAAIRAREALPPIDLAGTPLTLDSVRWRRVRATGVYEYAHERVWAERTYQGAPGVALLTPLRLSDGRAVLVDRGWVPSPDAVRVDAERWREGSGDSAEVAGLAVPPPSTGLRKDPGYPVLPFVIEDTIPPRPREGVAGSVPWRWPSPELSDGPHLSYAIQWFSFAVIILGGSLILYRKRALARRSAGETTI